ncbi:Glutamine-rich protein 2 [Labeo rohita]|uniref:Glutamine-rich protein 2 n=1 Tax=Labeo rohita TaxID=84645 RepID=A0ABQ8MUW9_LABRO|nr:Glutamine-rich protein 2 [Labeo rohita]
MGIEEANDAQRSNQSTSSVGGGSVKRRAILTQFTKAKLPSTTMSTDISLRELVDLSIGTPDAGSVNFSALHTLLHAILGHLKIERVTTTWKGVDNDHDSPSQTKALLLDSSSPYRAMEEKVRRMEEQMCALEALPSASELMGSDTALSDMWTLMQLRRKAQANEDGVSKLLGATDQRVWSRDGHCALIPWHGHKCMALIQDLLKEIQTLKESRDDLREEVSALNGQLSQKELKDKMAQYPVPEELTQCVTWEVMQAALISERQKIQEGLKDTLSAAKNIAPVYPLNLGTPFKDDRAGGTGGVDLSRRVSPPQQSQSDGALCTVTGRRLSRVSIGAERYPETVEALMEVGRLRDKHESLETRVGQLEANKADWTQLQHLRDLLNAMGMTKERQIPDHVPEQLNHLRTLMDSLLADKEKVSDVESVLMNMKTVQVCESSDSTGQSTGSASGQDTHASKIEQLNLQTAHIRIAVLKLDEKVQELIREKMRDERYTSPLSQSGQQEAISFSKADEQAQSTDQDQAQSSGQAQGQRQTGGQGLDQEVSQLSQCHDKPKDKTAHLMNQEHEDRNKNTDLVSDLEAAILQLQSKCEKLHSTSNRLMEEHSKKQTHIDRLYKIVEELAEKKADKEVVEMEIEIKADKRALESKVSRMQFDSMTEQLNNMLQELLSKISGQEQDWNKLNRIELDPLKKQLDDRWRTIHKHLQTPPIPEQDDAAGLRKHLVTLPSAPGLPSHKSSRPYTVYELEQVRQHCKSLEPGTNQDNFKMACFDRGLAQDERSHVLICRQIDQEPSQCPTSRTPKLPYSQGLPEISRTRYRPSLGPGKRSSRTVSKHYLTRNCGGSHTLTYPSRRYTRLQHITHLIQSEEESRPVSSGPPAQAAEVDILGLDGQVYKGRMSSRAVRLSETRFPTISPREGKTICQREYLHKCLLLITIQDSIQSIQGPHGPDHASPHDSLRNASQHDRITISIRTLDPLFARLAVDDWVWTVGEKKISLSCNEKPSGSDNGSGGKLVSGLRPSLYRRIKERWLKSQRSTGVDGGRGSPARPQSAKTQRSRSASSTSMKDRPMSSMDCLSQDVPLQTSYHDTTAEQREALELHKELNQSEDEPVTSL